MATNTASSVPPVSDARLDELIEFHCKLRCLYAEQHDIGSACIADDVVCYLSELRQLRARAEERRLGPREG